MSESPPPPYGPASVPPPTYSPYESPGADPAKRRSRLTVLIAAVAAVVALGAAIAIPLVNDDSERVVGGANDRGSDDGDGGDPTVNLDDVEVIETQTTTHTRQKVDYDQDPPVGGPHNPVWLDCGVYDEPVPNENVVHDLEHGTVWITYRPGLDQSGIDSLTDVLPQNGILSPYDGLDAPVVVTVWGTRLELEGADDPRLPLFIAQYGAGETAPEPLASCAGGLREPPPLKGAGTAV